MTKPAPRRRSVLMATCIVLGTLFGAGAGGAMAQSLGEPRYWDLPPVIGDMALARAVATGPDGFVAIGTQACRTRGDQGRLRCFGEVWTSLDGGSWEPVGPGTSGIELGDPSRCGTGGRGPGLIDVGYGPAGYLAVGYVAGAKACPVLRLWRSPDGRAWEQLPNPGPFPKGFQPSVLAGTADEYVIGGVVHRMPALPRAALWTSIDGLEWQRARPREAFGVGGYLNTGEAPDSGRIMAVTPTSAGRLAVGDACPDTFSGVYLNSFESLPPACFGQSWSGAGMDDWTRLPTPPVPDLVDVESIGERVVAAAAVCRTCPPVMLVADVDHAVEPATLGPWSFAYGAPVGGRLLDLTASDEHFWALLVDATGSAFRLWSSDDGTLWQRHERQLDLPEPMTFDERAGVEAVALSDRIVVVAGGATVRHEDFRSLAMAVPLSAASAD